MVFKAQRKSLKKTLGSNISDLLKTLHQAGPCPVGFKLDDVFGLKVAW
jgi:hypothetical protein